jgi:hypothetical protein
LTLSEWELILKKTGGSSDTCALARAWYAQLGEERLREQCLPNLLEAPIYKWCAQCFREDKRPYLRWGWRFDAVKYCVKHDVRLASKCKHCGGRLLLKHALMVSAGPKVPIFNLSYCQHCEMPLGGETRRHKRRTGKTAVEKARLQQDQELLMAIAEKRPAVKQKLERRRWRNEQPLAENPFMSPVGKMRPKVLHLTGEVFLKESQEFAATRPKRPRWSSLISRKRQTIRSRLAYALRLLRHELRIQKTEAAMKQSGGAGESR